jgi:pilus assembly protein CpaD
MILKLVKNTQSKAIPIAFAALAACALSGCSADQIEMENKYVPYAGSDQYPINVAHGKASVKPCGDWSMNANSEPLNDHLSNHGCAVQSNIAAMIANPDDILHPDKMKPGPSAARTTVLATSIATGTGASSSGGAAASGGGAAGGGGAGGSPQ